LHKIRGPFNVSGPAQACAIACLDDDDFLEKSRQHNQKWLDIYKSEIANLKNLIAHEALANFILLDFLNEKNCQNAQKIFLENNIILREMSAYSLNNCLRLTIGKDQENHQVLEILKQISKF
jgi:histidinol-phosphate aminotransferase